MSLLDTVVWCRQVFIKAAVEIVKRRWIATAYANEARHLANKNARKMKVKCQFRTEFDSITLLSLGSAKKAREERAKR